jgi:pimeloyl-ACP methyl ester carboxylesterase
VLDTPVAAEVHVGSISLEVFSRGSETAPRILFLHDLDYLNGVEYRFVEALAERFRVLAPSPPGFGGSPLPEDFDSVDDLAYAFLDWLAEVGPVHLVGAGFGGWIAAEMAVRCTHHLRSLTLVDALGIKVGDRTTTDIKDLFVLGPREVIEACWHDTELGERLMPLPVAGKGYDEDTLTRLLANRRTAALLGWNPFMHNPKLRSRLGSVDVPTLVVWGESDRLVAPEYGRAYANAIPRAQFALIRAAGHYPYLEQPDDFVRSLDKHLTTAA